MIERAEKERQAKALEAQRERDGPELARMEDVLGWKIEGVKRGCRCCAANDSEDLLLMRFTLVDPAEPLREFAICLDVSKQDYTGSFRKISSGRIDTLSPKLLSPSGRASRASQDTERRS